MTTLMRKTITVRDDNLERRQVPVVLRLTERSTVEVALDELAESGLVKEDVDRWIRNSWTAVREEAARILLGAAE